MTKSDPATTGGDATRTEVGSVFVSNYPPYSFWEMEQVPNALDVLRKPAPESANLGLYLHIPFCRRRCKFCYFKVYTEKNSGEVKRYLDALGSEAAAYASRPRIDGRPLEFVYFGGGTPSFVSARQLRDVVARVKQSISWDGVREVTFECEPGTLTRPKLEAIRGIGVTRLSLGVENMDDAILEQNGRAHTTKEIDRVAPWVRSQGFDQVNLDLIAGMVGETWESWRRTVQKTLEMDPDSVTVYQMELPFNTIYSRQVLDGANEIPVADWQLKREWHDYAFERFEAAGYEVSSAYTVVRKDGGARFVYRDAVWHGCDLLGAGVASFSHVGGVHFQNESGWEPYLSRVESGELPIARAYATTEGERLTREAILQLKLGRLDSAYFKQKFGVDLFEKFSQVLSDLERDAMIEPVAGGVRLTRQGLLRVDSLLPGFYAPDHRGARYT
jgi:oxygen-independent coproporphyrinogen-3 oxidase